MKKMTAFLSSRNSNISKKTVKNPFKTNLHFFFREISNHDSTKARCPLLQKKIPPSFSFPIQIEILKNIED